jgi:hypothetical protein
MLTLEERDAIEADFRWYRYSKFAFPFLIFMLAIAIMVFCLTAWQQVGSYKWFSANGVGHGGRQGVPHLVVAKSETEADEEGGLPKNLRNVRVATISIGITGIILIFLVLYSKPRPKIRSALNYFLALFLLATCVLAWIGFSWGLKRYKDARQCPYNFQRTHEKCLERKGAATITVVADGTVGIGSLVSLILLVYYTSTGDWRLQRTGWRERERDAETEVLRQRDPKHMAMHNIRNVRITILSIFLIFTLAALVWLLIFLVILHRDHDTERRLEVYAGNQFRGEDLNLQSGWPSKNTRMRYAFTIIVILGVLVNLIPFTHRIIAYIFAIVYFGDGILGLVNFGFDIHELHRADDLGCPAIQIPISGELKCVKSGFIATVVLEFILAILLIVYVLYEIVGKCFARSKWSRRQYAIHELGKHDRQLDSLRPVRCEVTGRVMTAKEYVYRWRFIGGTPAEADYIPPVVQPMFSAPGYHPGPVAFAAAAPAIVEL